MYIVYVILCSLINTNLRELNEYTCAREQTDVFTVTCINTSDTRNDFTPDLSQDTYLGATHT
jgi:hypothetical protein